MIIHSIKRRLRCPLALVFLWAVWAAGCDQSARSLSLDQPKAREVCQTFLQAWQDGKKLEDLKPNIIGVDHVWHAGEKLVSFEILPGETSDGTNLNIPVRLTLKDGAGRESKADVTYIVGTSPVVTVNRVGE